MTPPSQDEPTVQQLFDLTGKVALITGGSGHLGRSMASALAEAGASVLVSSRDESRVIGDSFIFFIFVVVQQTGITVLRGLGVNSAPFT